MQLLTLLTLLTPLLLILTPLTQADALGDFNSLTSLITSASTAISNSVHTLPTTNSANGMLPVGNRITFVIALSDLFVSILHHHPPEEGKMGLSRQ